MRAMTQSEVTGTGLAAPSVWSEWQGAEAVWSQPLGPQTMGSRRVVLAVADGLLRETLAAELRAMRWGVREAEGAAGVLALLAREPAAAVILDPWLPDLEMDECVAALAHCCPEMDILASDGSRLGASPPRGAHRAELFYAMHRAAGPGAENGPGGSLQVRDAMREPAAAPNEVWNADEIPIRELVKPADRIVGLEAPPASVLAAVHLPEAAAELPEFVGRHPGVAEVRRRIRLVAHRRTPVLVHGASGTGKELVARALHRLSGRSASPFVVINCAAIPEALIEAELFGHARGAFTGAQGRRIGRIEAAAGGTLFLDEVGELPLPAQAKLLRFLASGEIQRVGENDTQHVDVRVVAATHRPLAAMAAEGGFRLDLLHRLSVFLIQTPPLAGRPADLDALIAHTLASLALEEPAKVLSEAARARLHAHAWPGNVRELEHTLERGWILAGESAVIDADSIEFCELLG